MLQYEDDTVFIFEGDLESAKNLKFILCIFEQLSGLKIKFYKSEVCCFGEAKIIEDQYASIFTCKKGVLPFRYLGVPIHYKRLRNSD
jgi:hypothetical protein